MRAQCRLITLFLLKNGLSIAFPEHSSFKRFAFTASAAIRVEYTVRLFVQRASCQVIIVILRLCYSK